MGLINVYNSIGNSSKEIKANGKLSDILPNYDFSHAIILNAGNRLTPDYEVKENDVLFLRVIPRGVTATIIAVTAAVVIAGAAVGAVLYNNKRLQDEQQKAQRNAANLAQQIDNYPFIKGAKNRGALGNPIQYLIGRMYNTPYFLTDGFYSVSGAYGKEQYFNAVLSLGYGNQKIESVYIGNNIILENDDGISSGVHNFKTDSVYYDPENKIEIRQAGEEFTLDGLAQKVIVTQDGAEIKHEFEQEAEEVIREIADNTQKLEVCIQFNGLRSYNSELETWQSRKATVRPYWSNDGGATWHEFYFSDMTDNTINVNSKNTIRFVATKEFTPVEVLGKSLLLKVVKETPKAESNTNEDCFLAYYQSFCYDAQTSNETELKPCKPLQDDFINKTTRIGIKIRANDNTSGLLDDIHAITTAYAPIWNGEQWSDTKEATENPAAAILEILTSGVHKFSKIDRSEIDLESLGALYEFCEENELKANTIITSPIKKGDVLNTILQNINATMFIDSDGLYSFVVDKKEEIPVALLNAESVKSISYAKELKRKTDGVKVTYTNSKTWQIDTFYAMLNGGQRTQDDIITELNLEYITDYEQAYKKAQRYLRALILQPRTFTVSVGKSGYYYPLYGVVLLQNKEFRQGLKSSTITGFTYDAENNVNGLRISDFINFEEGKNYGVIIQAVTPYGRQLHYKKIIGSGLTREFALETPITEGVAPQALNIVSIGYLDENGEFETITNKMKIYGINQDSSGYTLTVKDYNPALYEFGDIPPYYSNITRPPVEAQTIPAANFQEIKGKAGEQGASAFNYLGVYTNYSQLPASTNGDFWLCGEDFDADEELAVNNDILEVNGDALGVTHTYKKGFIYYSNARGIWLEVKNKNNYRYIIASNDLELMGESLSPALNAATVEKVYEETGLDALEDKEIINEETKTIKADLIDAETIKGKEGFFDNISSNNGSFINAEVSGEFKSLNGVQYNNNFNWNNYPEQFPDLFNKINEVFPKGLNGYLMVNGNISIMSSTSSGGYFRFINIFFNSIKLQDNGYLHIEGIATDQAGGFALKYASLNIVRDKDPSVTPNGYSLNLNDQEFIRTNLGSFNLTFNY